jgi:uncharacterized metal-binding protein YceD (DUF177 family)
MSDKLKIYIDRLQEGNVEKINQTIPPDFLDVQEEELSFPEKVDLAGEAYLAEDHLIVHLRVKTTALLPCSICNAPVAVPLALAEFYLSEALNELKGPIFDLTFPLREAILLEIPAFAECNGGNCPERKNLAPYLKKSNAAQDHFPFENLDKK